MHIQQNNIRLSARAYDMFSHRLLTPLTLSSMDSTCLTMYIATFLIIDRKQKQPRCPSNGEWIMEMYICVTKFYLAIKKNKIMKFTGKWIKTETIVMTEVTQSQNSKYHIFPLLHGYQLHSDIMFRYSYAHIHKYTYHVQIRVFHLECPQRLGNQ